MNRLAFILFLISLSTCLGSCSRAVKNSNALIARLNNRGPVALSSDNPFLAGNLLLSKEMEQSEEVKGFVQHRGPPAAIEVERHYFDPLLMYFYYPESREVYTFESADNSWIISGPQIPDKEKLRAISLLTRNVTGEPKLVESEHQIPPLAALKEPSLETPPPVAIAQPATKTTTEVQQLKSDDPSALGARIEALTQIDDKHPAEISPRGDLVHYITLPGETLSIIARWYTYDRTNAPRISRINGLKNPDHLSIGDSVIIPAYLVKNKQRLTPEGLEMLKNIARTQG